MSKFLNIEYEKYTLPNGLDVILHQNKKIPSVAVNLWYKVGSANERKGKTGFAHLFEHMMFQGSQNVEKEMHFKYIQEAGGSLNGSTSFDRTNYYESLPANNLELALWLESDRMGFLLPALTQEKLTNQIEVVSNERRQRYDNQPYGLAWEKLFGQLFGDGHPYSWPTIGWMEDIQNFRLDDIKEFFRTYYSPSNASLCVAGNFETDNAKILINEYFASISNNVVVPKVNSVPVVRDRESTEVLEDNIQLERLYLAWVSDKLYGKEDAALDVLSDVLGGQKNSRLNKRLVFDLQTSLDASCFQYSGQFAGSFIIASTVKPGNTIEDLKKEIFAEIEKIKNEGISESELVRAKNSIKSNYIYSLQNISTLADQLNNYNCNLNEPNSFAFDVNRYEQLTQNDIKVVAAKYLKKNYAELQIIPRNEKV